MDQNSFEPPQFSKWSQIRSFIRRYWMTIRIYPGLHWLRIPDRFNRKLTIRKTLLATHDHLDENRAIVLSILLEMKLSGKELTSHMEEVIEANLH